MLTILRALFMFAVASVFFVEVIGYFWHRFAEHVGILGGTVQYRHIVHHEKDYPVDNLRPADAKYKSAGAWTWYALAIVSLGILFILAPLRDAIPLAAGALIYAKFVVDYFHESFHLENTWLTRFAWFKRLTKLHDIHHWVPGNYGIVFFWMDTVFGTLITEFPEPKVKQKIFP
jgi:sterol desaturase/sphingolipid hydroxylase (fatty acid hydroxylase superfamily)